MKKVEIGLRRTSLRGVFNTFAYCIVGLLAFGSCEKSDPAQDEETQASCEAFCGPRILLSVQQCLMGGEAVERTECLDACARENLAPATQCALEAGDCAAFTACLDEEQPGQGEPQFGSTVSEMTEVTNDRLTIRLEFMDQLTLKAGRQSWMEDTMAPYSRAAEKWLDALRGVDGLERHTIVMQVTVGPLSGGNGVAGPDTEITVGQFSIPTLGRLMVGNHTYVEGFDQVEFNANILHEMGHIIGIGSYTTAFVKDGATGPEFRAPTTNGVDQYNKIYGTSVDFVPISDDRGHLHDHVLQEDKVRMFPDGTRLPPLTKEFMANGAVFGAVTLGVLDDIGYSVDYTAAEKYSP